ncbi:hypothetical protein NWF24_30830 [Variovorax paradoxus]|uniref:hypothetical protein n=1 Tax=Variovorax paradoxus TaxID=34073 RepID=UPI0021ABFE64|nr:hypothetical protein [Variovorax paradoxus]UVH57185.1 hypothetical protein NWF24_30830 [Variovorax paradoxus]
MAKIISGNRIVPVWLEALEHLEVNHRRFRNLVLEIESPVTVTKTDRAVIGLVDPVLRARCGTNVVTVAGTIFPWGLYKKTPAATLPKRFLEIMGKAQEPGSWGTYAMRLMSRPGKKPGETINPLYEVVRKLKKASTDGVGYNSNYELGVHAPEDLLSEDIACEVPLYNPAEDRTMISKYPCLSHLTFKLIERKTIELTAIYRSHYYLERALGNLIGLTHLMRFVVKETGLEAGRLTCISTDAHLDVESWGGVAKTRPVLEQLKAAAADEAPAAPSAPKFQMSDTCAAA